MFVGLVDKNKLEYSIIKVVEGQKRVLIAGKRRHAFDFPSTECLLIADKEPYDYGQRLIFGSENLDEVKRVVSNILESTLSEYFGKISKIKFLQEELKK